MKRVAQIRRDLDSARFSIYFGPLTNPANVKAQVIGVFDGSLCEPMANVLNILGSKRGAHCAWWRNG